MSDSKALLTVEQIQRYQRHLNLPQVGVEGQRKLLDARVLLIGAGGLGCPAAQYLAAAGVGTLGLVDFDRIEMSNLQRQVLFRTLDIGRPKVLVAKERIEQLNPDVNVEVHDLRLTADNALEILRGYDVIVDGTDNFSTRYLVNDACVFLKKPNVHGSIFRFEGQSTLFCVDNAPCYRCLYREPPPPELAPSCAEGGVLGVLPGMIAMVQATETIKLLLGLGPSLAGRLIQYDALAMRFAEFRVPKDPACPVCGDAPTITTLRDLDTSCASAVQQPTFVECSVLEAKQRLCEQNVLLLDVREPHEAVVASIAGAHLIPLAQLPARLAEIEQWKTRRVLVHCHYGGRSAKACKILIESGFLHVENVQGGIDAWAREIDVTIRRY